MAQKGMQKAVANIAAKSVVESNPEFRDGVCSGYLTYYDRYKDKPLTDVDVHNFLFQNLMDASGTDSFNSGYCVGWIEALIEDRQILYTSAEREREYR